MKLLQRLLVARDHPLRLLLLLLLLGQKKTRFQSDAPDDLQLAMDITAALAKDKEIANSLPAQTTTGNINVVAAASAGDGAGDAAADNVVPSTPPTLG